MQRRAVLVLGATGVLGRAIVRQLSQNDLNDFRSPRLITAPLVVATFCSNRVAARQLRSETACWFRTLDVTDEAQTQALWHELPCSLRQHNARLSGVVFAAGVARDALMPRMTRANWEHSQRVNLEGAFLIVRAALKYLPRGGRVVVLASRVGENGGFGQSAYAAHKAALLALMRVAAREGGPRGIAVNAVCPGFTLSPMTQTVLDDAVARQRERDAFGELGCAQTTANVVSWLLSEAAQGISGQVWHADARLI